MQAKDAKPLACDPPKENIKEEAFDCKCKHHPEFDLDTICFHPNCRQNHAQIICYYCGSEQQAHAAHTQDMYPIYRTSPGFRLINFQNEPRLLAQISAEQQKTREKVAGIKERMFSVIEQLGKKAEQRLQCLQDFVQKNGVFKICSRMRRYGDVHTDCCLPLLNSLKDLSDQPSPTSQQACEVVNRQIEKQAGLFDSQISFIQQQFLRIIDHAAKGTLASLPPQVENRVATSELIPMEQAFNEIISIRLCQEAMNIDCNEVKRSESSLMKNQENPIYHADLGIAVQEQPPGMNKEPRANKLVKINNEENKSSPIDVDAEDLSPESHHSHDSIINQLDIASSFIAAPSSLHQNQQKIHNKTLKCPFGSERANKHTVIIWNASKIDAILKFLFASKQVTHLIVLDGRMPSEKILMRVITGMPWLQGLHLHCKSQLAPSLLANLKLPYFSYFTSYRFINVADRARYFPRGKPTALIRLPPCLTDQHRPTFRNVFIRSSDCSPIKAETEEVSFVHDDSGLLWVFGNGIEQNLLRPDRLMVLVFSSILIRKTVDFKPVFEKQRFLHTIVFEDCEGRHSEIISQLRFLRTSQLKHLQLSGENLDHKIQLTQSEAEVIFSQRSLESLILTSVEFTSTARKKEPTNSHILRGITNLDNLKHLNLYNTEPVYSDLLSYLSRPCVKGLTSLNLGCSEIDSSATLLLQRHTHLQELAIDYTELSESDLLKATAKMKNLQFLSIENLNGGKIVYEQGWTKSKKNYGTLTPNFFKRLKHKNLRYVNIYNCQQLADYDWNGYSQLECLRVSRGLPHPEIASKLIEKDIVLYMDDADMDEEPPKLKSGRERERSPSITPSITKKQIKGKQKTAKPDPCHEKQVGTVLISQHGQKKQEGKEGQRVMGRSQLSVRPKKDLSSGSQGEHN